MGGSDDNDQGYPSTLTAAGAVAALEAKDCPQFRYWVDEILWSQGRIATIQIEEVLNQLGGIRTGGPHKQVCNIKGSLQGPTAISIMQLQQGLDAVGLIPLSKQPQLRGMSSATLAEQDTNSSSQQDQSTSCRSHTAYSSTSSASTSLLADNTKAAATTAEIAADPAGLSGEPDSSSISPGGLNRRTDDSLLGYQHVKRWDLLWTKSVYAIKAARQLQPGQLVSAIAGLNCLTMKKRMVQTLRMALGPKAFCIVPLSFCIPEDLPAWEAWLSSPAAAAADTGLWMLKTGQDAGKGLRLVPTQHALQAALRQPKNPSRPQNHIKVAQQYITNPLLIHGRKFHLRLWMVVTSHSPLRAYLHNQGLVLFSSEVYDQSRPVEGFGAKPAVGHVTNYARNEDTWVWGLEQLQEQLGQQQWQQLWDKMREATALTAAAVLGPLRAAHRWLQPSISNYGFQMVGLDFLIDDQMHPWLLEVNSAPSIMAVHSVGETCRLIKSTKQAMLTDMLALVQHRVLPQGSTAGSSSSSGRSGGVAWQEELTRELSNRGGFEPLMDLFPLQHVSIPWQEVDKQLQQYMKGLRG